MRYLGAVAFFFAVFFGVVIFAAPPSGAATAARSAQPPALSVQPAPLTQSGDTWSTAVYLGTAGLCQEGVSYDLVTTVPYSDTPAAKPMYVVPGSNPQRMTGQPTCPSPAAAEEVMLSFTPKPSLAATPLTATLVVSPSAAALAAGATPLAVTLTVDRQVSTRQYLWIPLLCGLALALALVAATMAVGVPKPDGGMTHMHRTDFWRLPLHASSAWTFGDSWATNITGLSTVVGAVLTASGSVAEVFPGVELGRFGLLIALAGGITIAAPLLFGALNYVFSSANLTTTGVAEISLTREGNDQGVRIGMPATGTVAVHGIATLPEDILPQGAALNPGISLDIPADAVLTVSAPDFGAGAIKKILALPGTGDIVVTSGQQLSVNTELTLPASAVVTPAAVAAGEHEPPRPVLVSLFGQLLTRPAAAPAPAPAEPVRVRGNTFFTLPYGAKISFLGRACLTLPAQSVIDAPVSDPSHPAHRTTLPAERGFAFPRTGEVVAAKMWTMLAASCLTMFGIGAEIGIIGWVLGFDLAAAPTWARGCCLGLAIVAALLVLGYGVTAIRALADSREGTALSGPDSSSFML